MRRFTVWLNADAEDDILNSYEWGVENWGEAAAEKWIGEMYDAMLDRLSTFPERCPIAPDVDLPDREIMYLPLGRYRILYEIRGSEVIILHVRGPFAGD